MADATQAPRARARFSRVVPRQDCAPTGAANEPVSEMPSQFQADTQLRQHPRRNVRLDTLVRLRWLAVIGQTSAILVVHYGFDFTLPLVPCLAVIAASASLNVGLRLGFSRSERLAPDRAAYLLAFDIAQLAALLYLTGGLENPFAFLLLGPVLI